MLPVRAVVFDLDGTLIDSRGDIAAACNYALATAGLPTLSVGQIGRFVGDGARKLLARASSLPESTPAVDKLLSHFLDYYTAHPVVHTRLMPHVEETLASLAAGPYRLAICTNKPRRTTEAVLDSLPITRYFAAVVAGDDLPTKKPDPAPVEALATVLRLVPRELVMVGDGPQDVFAGRAAGARTVGVRGGFLPIERLLESEPDVLLDTLATLPTLVHSWADATVIARPLPAVAAKP